jgi:hypothetical protein
MVAQRESMNGKLQKHISTYELFARYLPAILTCVPVLLLGFALSRRNDMRDLMAYLLSLKFFGYVTISFICLYFYAQLIRSAAKHFERRYFQDRRGFPTTYFMLYSDGPYSDAYKDEFRRRVKETFGFQLCTKDEEQRNMGEAIKRLNDITKRIIFHVGDGVLVGKHNQWYGFMRNLVGGSIYGVVGAVLTFTLGKWVLDQNSVAYTAIFLCIPYGFILLFRRSLIVQHAEAYARQLHAEFMK